MLKNYKNLTPEDKRRFLEASIVEFEKNSGGLPWSVVKERAQAFLDCAFDDKRFPQMSPDDQIDAAFCRKEFGKKKPELVDFLIWTARFVAHSDLVEVPDK